MGLGVWPQDPAQAAVEAAAPRWRAVVRARGVEAAAEVLTDGAPVDASLMAMGLLYLLANAGDAAPGPPSRKYKA